MNFLAVSPLIFCLLYFPSPSVSISHSFYLFPSVCSFLCPPLFFSRPLSLFPFVCLFHYECSLTCPCTITKPGCLFMLHQGITLFFCYYFFCEVASVWLAPDSAPPSHPHYIFTLRYPRTQWCTCTHIFFSPSQSSSCVWVCFETALVSLVCEHGKLSVYFVLFHGDIFAAVSPFALQMIRYVCLRCKSAHWQYCV